MESVIVYYISICIFLSICIVWRLCQIVGRSLYLKCVSGMRKILRYYIVIPRCRGSSDISVEAFIILWLYILANIIACTFQISDIDEINRRCVKLFLFNFVLLFLFGSRGPITNKLLNIDITSVGLIHRWIGRICIVEGVTHTICKLLLEEKPSAFTISVSHKII